LAADQEETVTLVDLREMHGERFMAKNQDGAFYS